MAFENAQQMIPKIQAFFADQPIKRAWLFGSYSRGEERPDSDVDILVEYENSDEISLFAISRMMSSLKKILNRKVMCVNEIEHQTNRRKNRKSTTSEKNVT